MRYKPSELFGQEVTRPKSCSCVIFEYKGRAAVRETLVEVLQLFMESGVDHRIGDSARALPQHTGGGEGEG